MTANLLRKYRHTFHPVVPFNPASDKLLLMDFTQSNKALTPDILDDTVLFEQYITATINNAAAKYGIGGYNENRVIYSHSRHFNVPGDEPRRLHLGIDIWGAVDTPVCAPMGGMVHSFAYNSGFGDYGATIVLLHQLDGTAFYTLYGHLALKDMQVLNEGQYVNMGQVFGHFGTQKENGHWPPHLHFQLINDMQLKEGDYPGVCKLSEREKYLHNCPDPDLILNMMQFVRPASATSF